MSRILSRSLQKAAQRRKAALKDAEAGVRALPLEDVAAEPLACPQCGQRYDFGDMCIDCDVRLIDSALVSKQPAAAKPIVVEGPRYQCESCGERSSDHIVCPACGGTSMLDLTRFADVQYIQALDAMTAAGSGQNKDLAKKIAWIGLVGLGLVIATGTDPGVLRTASAAASFFVFLLGLFSFSTLHPHRPSRRSFRLKDRNTR